MERGQIETTIDGTTYRLDFVIAGTGYSGDLASRPELRDFGGQIQFWRDRHAPPHTEQDDRLGCYPYLGAGHELLEKVAGAAPLLKHVHVQNPAGFLSFGLPIGDVPSMKRDIPVIVSRVSADLFLADLDALRSRSDWRCCAVDFTDELYRSAVR